MGDKSGNLFTPDTTEQSSASEVLASYSTDDLFSGSDEIHIQHEGEIYRMRITRNRKLILTK